MSGSFADPLAELSHSRGRGKIPAKPDAVIVKYKECQRESCAGFVSGGVWEAGEQAAGMAPVRSLEKQPRALSHTHLWANPSQSAPPS